MTDGIDSGELARTVSLVLNIIKKNNTAAYAARTYDLTVAEIAERVADAVTGMENQLPSKPKDVAQQYEAEIKDLRSKSWRASSSQ